MAGSASECARICVEKNKNVFNLIPGTSCGSFALALLLLVVCGPQFGKLCTNDYCWPGALLVILPAVNLYYLDVIGKKEGK